MSSSSPVEQECENEVYRNIAMPVLEENESCKNPKICKKYYDGKSDRMSTNSNEHVENTKISHSVL